MRSVWDTGSRCVDGCVLVNVWDRVRTLVCVCGCVGVWVCGCGCGCGCVCGCVNVGGSNAVHIQCNNRHQCSPC